MRISICTAAAIIACLTVVQAADKKKPDLLTNSHGIPLQSLDLSMTAGPLGDLLLKDATLTNHLAAFDRERIPERVVHAKGAAAFGFFEVTTDTARKYCRAKMFSEIGKQTPMAARFSTVGGEKGSADTVRDPRGFALKFYTEEGNWDLVGNNTPVFFISDPILFPSFIHTQKRNPKTNLKDPDMFWDFLSLRPESILQTFRLFSDRGTPDGFRKMDGFGSHTFKNVNSDGEVVYVKYHFRTDQGIGNLTPEDALKISAVDPDYSVRDLYTAIDKGDFPSWTAYLQVMSIEDTKGRSEAFDVTKSWSETEFPLQEIGRFTLNRTPTNFFTDVEMLAFNPNNFAPGVGASPDRMLQGRLFSYGDTQRHRLGPNNEQIPVNRPLEFPPKTYERDGFARVQNPPGPNYFPNSFGGPQPNPAFESQDIANDAQEAQLFGKEGASAGIVDRYPINQDFYSQPAGYYNSFSAGEKARLSSNIAGSLYKAQKFIRDRYVGELAKVNQTLSTEVHDKMEKLLAATAK